MQDDLRVFYVPLAIVVGMTLIASLFVAFSFIPALVTKVLPARSEDVNVSTVAAGDSGARRAPVYERFYRDLVSRSVRWPWIAVVIGTVSLGGSYYLFQEYVTRGVVWGGGFGGFSQTYIIVQVSLPEGPISNEPTS